MVVPAAEMKFVPSLTAMVGAPAKPSDTKMMVPAPAVTADGAVATVKVGS